MRSTSLSAGSRFARFSILTVFACRYQSDSTTMNALRVAARQPARALCQKRLASTISVVSHTSSASALPLSNVEALWEKLPKEEQVAIYRQLETLQKKDWNTLTLDEKKAGMCMGGFVTTNMSFPFPPVCYGQRALTKSSGFVSHFMSCSHISIVTAYYVAFGPYGPRTPVNPPGTAVKVGSAVAGLVAVTAAIIATLRHYGTCSF